MADHTPNRAVTEHISDGDSFPRLGTPLKPGIPIRPKVNVGSWAAIAATATTANNRIVKFGPNDSLTRQVPPSPTVKPDDPDDARVVWMKPWGARRPLSHITSKISQGPIFSIVRVEEEEAVCVIFQYGLHAAQLLEAEEKSVEEFGETLWGLPCTVTAGVSYPKTEDINRMETEHERRRLTFARRGLFTGGMTEERFQQEMNLMVGEHNVERVWLFNTGNGKAHSTSHLQHVNPPSYCCVPVHPRCSHGPGRNHGKRRPSREVPGSYGYLFARSM